MPPTRLTEVEKDLKILALRQREHTVDSLRLQWIDAGLKVRLVRGEKMTTVANMFDEFAAALQFPTYFGGNWAAFDECMRDLENIPGEGGLVIVINEPALVLADEEDEKLRIFTQCLADIASSWSQAIDLGEWWDRAPVAFHVVLTGKDEQVEEAARRWSRIGATVAPWTSIDRNENLRD